MAEYTSAAGRPGATADDAALVDATPYQLRHAALTRICAAKGLEVARVFGGHAKALMTEGYSRQAELELARRIAGEMG